MKTTVLTSKHVVKSPRIVENVERKLERLFICTAYTPEKFPQFTSRTIELAVPSEDLLLVPSDSKCFVLEK